MEDHSEDLNDSIQANLVASRRIWLFSKQKVAFYKKTVDILLKDFARLF